MLTCPGHRAPAALCTEESVPATAMPGAHRAAFLLKGKLSSPERWRQHLEGQLLLEGGQSSLQNRVCVFVCS